MFAHSLLKRLQPAAAAAGLILLAACGSQNALTVYTSVDRDYSEPIINAFAEQNPEMEVNAVYDSEVTKTTGLYERIVHEKRNPQADVFWNNEIVRTIQLKHQRLLAPYESPPAADIPETFKDPERYWTGFSARARVMIINTDLVPGTETPSTVPALAEQRYRGKTGMAMPEFGTTAGHMAALYTQLGEGVFTLRFTNLVNNGVKFLPGNATVRDQVAAGQLAYGLTDTDDALAALAEGKPVRMAILGQDRDGTFLVPNTVALIRDAPHPENAKKFIDFLLSPETEAQLAQSRGKQIPVRPSVPGPPELPELASIKAMNVNYDDVARNLDPCLDLMRKFTR